MGRPQRRTALALLLLVACTSSETRYPTSATDTTNGGGIPRSTVTLTIQADAEARPAAEALGWIGGIPGAQVRALRTGTTNALDVQANQAGIAILPDLLPGTYEFSIVRILDDTERRQVESAGLSVDAFSGGGRAGISAPTSSVTFALGSAQRGSLVLSEIMMTGILTENVGFYREHQFIELYNNADTTVFLDRKIIGKAFGGSFDRPNFPCSLYAPFTQDSLGIWATYFYRFPGNGTNYPLGPGQTAVIALDAIDHTQVTPRANDLRYASFETIGTLDPDNPSVPNLLFVGAVANDPGGAHGFFLYELSLVVFVSDGFEKDTLPHMVHPSDRTYYRVPRGAILDLISHRYRLAQPTSPPCDTIMLPVHDRRPGEILTGTEYLTLKRKTLVSPADGRTVLQRTRATQIDFEAVTNPTPGVVP